MTEVDWSGFYNNFDFDTLWLALGTGSWKWILTDKIVWAIVVILVGMVAYKPTRELGSAAIIRGGVGTFYAIGAIVLKNSKISEPGPFALMGIMFIGVVGYLVWTKMLSSK